MLHGLPDADDVSWPTYYSHVSFAPQEEWSQGHIFVSNKSHEKYTELVVKGENLEKPGGARNNCIESSQSHVIMLRSV